MDGHLNGTIRRNSEGRVRHIEILGLRSQVPDLNGDDTDEMQWTEISCRVNAGVDSQSLVVQFRDSPGTRQSEIIDPESGEIVAIWRYDNAGRLTEVELPNFGHFAADPATN